jgi:hypothetical protein
VTIRAILNLGEERTPVTLFAVLQETEEHLRLRLAAAVLFHALRPIHQIVAKHPALQGQEFMPDLMAVDVSGSLVLWVECGKTTPHKLSKVRKRFRQARMVILTATPREARHQLKEIESEELQGIEMLAFPEGEFQRWSALISDSNEIIGEATVQSMNLVVNEAIYIVDLERIP